MEVAEFGSGRDSFRTGASLKTLQTTCLRNQLIISYRGVIEGYATV